MFDMKQSNNLVFGQDARVVVIGASTVTGGGFIAKIFDYYRTHLPERRVKLYNFGVPGDTTRGFISKNRHELLLELQPTEVVIMFGLNDIGRHNYSDEHRNDPEYQKNAERCKEIHVEYMKKIACFLHEHGIPFTLCSTQPYDEYSDAPTENLIGCQAALEDIFKRAQKEIAPFGLKGVFDLHTPLKDLLIKMAANGIPSFLRSDRVHPTELGEDLFARVILHAQGLLPALPTLEDVINGTAAMPPLSEANRRRKEAEEHWRSTAWLDFNAQWGQENMTTEERCAYWREKVKTMSEADGFRYRAALLYPERKPHEKEYFDLVMQRTDEMYEQ